MIAMLSGTRKRRRKGKRRSGSGAAHRKHFGACARKCKGKSKGKFRKCMKACL